MANRLDLTGNIYGELTVVEMLYNYNNKRRTYCKCVTMNGDSVTVRADALQSGATHCAKGAGKTGKPMDVRGKRFGLLVAMQPTEKRSSNGAVIWECICDCGNTTYVPLGQLTRSHTLSCGCRHKSKWEMFIDNLLTDFNVEFVFQKRFPDCMNQKGSDMLPFDFYLPDYNIVIEYDGEHHFQPIKGWGGEEKFNTTKQNDCIKTNYCRENNIILLRIPYTKTKNEIKNEILSILSPVTITV